jgi:endonuclease/exonuclease/phosphatase family metal-dependent hydrolase
MKKLILVLFLLNLTSCNLDKDQPDSGDDNNPNVENSMNLKVGAFNIQIFGVSKMSNSAVVNTLIQIVSRYDLILIQEIRDSSGSTIVNFMEFLNDANQNQYDFVIGSRVGRSSSKEQYAFIYKKSLLEVISSSDFDDSSQDLFEREPLITFFRHLPSGEEFFAVGLHAKPEDAFNELQYLYNVYYYAEDLFNNNKSIIMGDFNADCTYLSDSQYNNLSLVSDSQFTWHFSKSLDTTVKSTDCAYDHIITTGSFSNRVSNREIFNFQNVYLLNQTSAEDVSDHYPVGITLSF